MLAKIENGQIVDRRAKPTEEGDWRPLTVEGRGEFDTQTHRETVEIVIEPDRVRQVFRLVPHTPPTDPVGRDLELEVSALKAAVGAMMKAISDADAERKKGAA